jgi:YD repeat-containing protein
VKSVAADASGTTTYTYDTMDHLTAKATPEGTVNYAYDAAGHVASIESANTDGASMSDAYDSLNRLSTVTDNRLTGSNVTTYTYDSASNVATVAYPNGVTSTFTYDAENRVTELSSTPATYSYTRGGGWPTLDMSTNFGCPILDAFPPRRTARVGKHDLYLRQHGRRYE